MFCFGGDVSGERFEMMLQRRLLTGIGLGLLPVAAAGLVLPLLPGTPILLLASFCLAKGSPRFESWLIRHPMLGPPILAWRANGAIPRPAKGFAGLALAASMNAAAISPAPQLIKVAVGIVLSLVLVYVISRPHR